MTMSKNDASELLEAIARVNEFIEQVPVLGCNYWEDEEGAQHTVDIGSVFEFLEDLEQYLQGKLEA